MTQWINARFYPALGTLGIHGLDVPAAKGDELPLELHFQFITPSKLFVDNAPEFASALLSHLLQLQKPIKWF